MRSDDSGVAGFFEDLPVLLIVLSGVAALVLSSSLASERIQSGHSQDDLDDKARRFVDEVLLSMISDPQMEHASIASIMSVNVTRAAMAVLGSDFFEISFVLRYPSVEWLGLFSNSEVSQPKDTGYASRLFNVALDDRTIGAVEVSAFVWID